MSDEDRRRLIEAQPGSWRYDVDSLLQQIAAFDQTPPCGVPGHEGGRWENVVLGIWWCPGCGEEIWVTEPSG